MKKIGGNTIAHFKGLSTEKNELGEMINEYGTIATHIGFLDYASGTSNYSSFNSKTEESTHIFICDYFDLNLRDVSRIVVGERSFDVLFSDNPMGLNYQFEFYLKEIVQDGK